MPVGSCHLGEGCTEVNIQRGRIFGANRIFLVMKLKTYFLYNITAFSGLSPFSFCCLFELSI